MTLRGARVALGPQTAVRIDLGVEDGRIRIGGSSSGPEIDCRGMLILPGLINAHDHLEFALFPRLGHGPYHNANEWARDIYRPSEPPIREHLAVAKQTRLWWGGLKNLLSGATTVMHHNPWEPAFDRRFPVRVVKRYGWAHSVAFSPDFAERYRSTPQDAPFCIHAAEGTDDCAAGELRRIEAAGALGRNTVVVHGVAADPDALRRAGASLVWCPTSNTFMLGRTLDVRTLSNDVPAALGTDSPLTSAGDLIDELEAAGESVGWDRAYRMVTTEAARVLRLQNGEGEIREGGIADLLAVHDRGQTPAESLRGLRPAAVWLGGELSLQSGEPGTVHWEGRGWYRIGLPVEGHFREAARALGPEIRLAGRRVST